MGLFEKIVGEEVAKQMKEKKKEEPAEQKIINNISENMFCTNCGKKIDEGAKFCANCGTVVVDKNKVREEKNSSADNTEKTREVAEKMKKVSAKFKWLNKNLTRNKVIVTALVLICLVVVIYFFYQNSQKDACRKRMIYRPDDKAYSFYDGTTHYFPTLEEAIQYCMTKK